MKSLFYKKDSLTRRTLVNIGIRIGIVIIIGTGISYFHMIQNLREQALGQLEKYVIERGQRERAIFLLAKDNHEVLIKAALSELKKLGDKDPKSEFNDLFARSYDGVIRNHPENFNGLEHAGVYIDENLSITPDIRRRVLTFYKLCINYGKAWHNRFQDTYITTPENIMVIFWPEQPDWCQKATTDLFMPDEAYVRVADKDHNPLRKTVWTGLFLDDVSKLFMISCSTPLYINDRQVGTISHDVTLNELLKRTIYDHLDGAYNIIFRSDGQLIAHPEKMKQIQGGKGSFDIKNSKDSHLKDIFNLVINKPKDKVVVAYKKAGEYIAVTRIEEPDWYFLTVFPRSIIEERAFSTARLVLLIGVAILMLEIFILYFILNRQIARPLKKLTAAAENVALGDTDINLGEERNDELGRLADSFSHMRGVIQDKIKALEQEIMERKRAEDSLRIADRRFRSLVDNIPGIVYRCDNYKGWKMSYISGEVEKISGYPASDFVNNQIRSYSSIIISEDREYASDQIKSSVINKKPFTIEYRIKTKDGLFRWVHEKGNAIYDDHADFLWLDGVIVDITERKKAEEQLRQHRDNLEELVKGRTKELSKAKEQAEAASKAKSEFLANMSHELRTPLNAVTGFSEILSNIVTDKKQKTYLNSIKTAGKSLLTLINDILDLSKIEANKMEIQLTAVNLKTVFNEVQQIFKIKTEEKRLQFIIEFDENLNTAVMLDETRLRQILLNLVGNAVKFTNKGYIRLKSQIKKESDWDKNIELIISVEDTGIGISPEEQKIIFEAFRQQSHQHRDFYGGTGLGLTICKRLVEMMNGQIIVESEAGKGSIFKIRLNDVKKSVSQVLVKNDNDFDLHDIQFEKAKILVVDDVESNRSLLKELLTEVNLKVLTAENGQEALIISEELHPDVILMDIRMPVMDGMEAAKHLKSNPKTKNIPVFAVTAFSTSFERDEILKMGFEAYISKPIKISRLITELCKYLPHKIEQKKIILSIEPDKNNLHEKILNPKELLSILKENIKTDLKTFQGALDIEKIQATGDKLIQLGERHQIIKFKQFGSDLISFAKSFDVTSIRSKLSQLEEYIENLIINLEG